MLTRQAATACSILDHSRHDPLTIVSIQETAMAHRPDRSAAALDVRELEQQFLNLCDRIGRNRELSIAKTYIETAAMWATRGCHKDEAPDSAPLAK